MTQEQEQLQAPAGLILASASPRRLAICRALGLKPRVAVANCPEITDGDPSKIVTDNALAKAKTVLKRALLGYLVLGADTVVVKNHQILGKPRGRKEAAEMLQSLGGDWHWVYTGMAVLDAEGNSALGFSATRVKFAALSAEEIMWYLATQEPFDKAGAYGIQGPGGIFIEGIEGDYNTVVGLCPRLLYTLSSQLGYDVKKLVKLV